ncbi:hypothetical protein CVU75_00520 [Candidatus Dependentiae bacterium HGW-Dependentiae-1]|nr:MAG: hypothetical protein CVU75_00520 [Candidatus Dependentiae bacterium HGW-Dependentiae-1]
MLLAISMVALAILGFVISLYAYFIEKKIAQNAAYKPVCDISATISCSKPILSSYGKLFGISNALLGVGYYFLFLVLLVLQAKITLYVLALIAFLFSLYFAWLLYFRIRALCILCTTTYVINILLLSLSFIYMR